MKHALTHPIQRLIREIHSPYYKSTRIILDILHSCIELFKTKSHRNNKHGILIWDIRSNAVTFDFLSLVYWAANKFAEKKINKFELIIYLPTGEITGPSKWNSYSNFVSSDEFSKRVDRIIIPLAQSMDCIESVLVIRDKDELRKIIKTASVLPKHFDPVNYYPEPLDYKYVFKTFQFKRNIVIPDIVLEIDINDYSQLFELSYKQKYITITLRDYGFDPVMNTKQTDIDIAYEFAKKLSAKLLIIPDNIDIISQYNIPNSAIVIVKARKNIYYRCLVYRESLVNIFLVGGPCNLPLFINGSRSIVIGVGGSTFHNDRYWQKKRGVEVGDQPVIRLGQYWFWHSKTRTYSANDLDEVYNYICSRYKS